MSPYSMKVRCYFAFKGIPFEWIPYLPGQGDLSGDAEVKKYAKLPIVPTVVTPDGRGM